jgi:hypothetical protein
MPVVWRSFVSHLPEVSSEVRALPGPVSDMWRKQPSPSGCIQGNIFTETVAQSAPVDLLSDPAGTFVLRVHFILTNVFKA